jgi:uncharacterized membrane protein HdeD (DUF308 family)
MSDMPMPDTRAGAVSRDAVRRLASSWWLFLILGIVWILFGMFVLSYNVGSLLALAVFIGVTFVMTGFTELFAAFDLRGLDQRLDQATERPAR